jgi:Ca2+-binding EF-hand superfamily protein
MKRLLSVILVAALATSAQAQVGGDRMPNPDVDHDGKVTLAEFKAMEQTGFLARLDADKNGKISKAEFKTLEDRARGIGGEAAAARAAGMFAMIDTDHDGVITKVERETANQRRFDMADTNHDGWLSKGEVLMMRQNRRAN